MYTACMSDDIRKRPQNAISRMLPDMRWVKNHEMFTFLMFWEFWVADGVQMYFDRLLVELHL